MNLSNGSRQNRTQYDIFRSAQLMQINDSALLCVTRQSAPMQGANMSITAKSSIVMPVSVVRDNPVAHFIRKSVLCL
jgi:hypothetical protein